MRPRDLARVFLEKAAQDEVVLAKFTDDPEVADEVIGFHAQQATEKLLKAVLINFEIEHERTHNLARLMKLAKRAGLHLPKQLTRLDVLSPFAVELRYALFPDDLDISFDRREIRDLVRQLREWVDKAIER